MPFSDVQRHLRDIAESIDRIDEFVTGMDFAAYRRDEKTKSAVERKLQILTEAVIRLEHVDPNAFPGIDRRGYRGMGNIRRHSYDRVCGRDRLEYREG